jgi:hypothetical protein
LKSFILNSDIFSKILTLKIKKKKMRLLGLMNIILNRAVLPKANSRLEKRASRIEKTINFNLLENKYLNSNINSILKISNVNLDNLLNNLYENILGLNSKKDNLELASKGYNKICEIIFNSIKYKNIGGVRLIVSGRLTKRYRADKALYKVK